MLQVVFDVDKRNIGIEAGECDKEHNDRINKVSVVAIHARTEHSPSFCLPMTVDDLISAGPR